MQQLKQFGRALKKNYDARYVIKFFKKKIEVTFVTFPIIGNIFEKNK